MGNTRARLPRGFTRRAGRATLGDGGGGAGPTRRASISDKPGGRRYPLYVLVGLTLSGAAVALFLVRRARRGGPQSEDAAPSAPPSVSEPSHQENAAGERTEAPSPRRDESGEAEVEERIRARIGEDPRTRDLPPLSIKVEDGMAWVDGRVPSQETREALTEAVQGVEGVNIVVNRVLIDTP